MAESPCLGGNIVEEGKAPKTIKTVKLLKKKKGKFCGIGLKNNVREALVTLKALKRAFD